MTEATLNVEAGMVRRIETNLSSKYSYMKIPSFGPLEHVDCALCGPGETSLVRVEPVFGEDFRVVRCPRCGLMFTNPRPTAEWKARFHDPACNGYISAQGRDFPCRPGMDRLPGYHRILGFLKKRARRGATLLDAGCATGFFVKTAKEYGFAATGCDCSEAAVVHGRKQFGVQLIHSPIEDVAVADDTFDVITLLRVFERFDDPMKVLSEVSRILKPGGLMLLETVNYLPHYQMEKNLPFLIPAYNKLTNGNGSPWVPFDHLFHWSPKVLLSAVDRSGFVRGRCHVLGGNGSVKPTGRSALAYRLCGMIGETLVRISRGQLNCWPMLMLTARKPG